MLYKRILFTLVLFIPLLLTVNSFAQIEAEREYNPLSGAVGLTVDGGLNISSVDLGKKLSFPTVRGGLEYFFSTSSAHAFGLRLLAGYNFLQFEKLTGSAKRNFVYDAKLGLIYSYGTGNFLPYASLGLNYPFYYSKKLTDDNKKLAFYGEGGLKFFISELFTVNFSGTMNFTGQDYLEGIVSNKNDAYGTVQAGLTYLLTRDLDSDGDGVKDAEDMCPNTPLGVKVDEMGCPVDSDKDGVPDYLDRCPATPTGVQVDSEGCPLDTDGDGVPDYLDKDPDTPKGVKVDAAGRPLDTDKDGVPDYKDKCPNTPKDVKVDKDGCPVDSDGDGVADYLDKCPDTPKGAKVDNDGCPVVKPEEAFKVTVYFGFDKSNLTKEAKTTLDKAVDFMKKDLEAMFSIEGHACWIGPEAYNMKLSERRANSVYEYIVKKGIDKRRFQTKGFGETMPAADNRTKEGRKLNRRAVVIQIFEK